MAESPPKGRDLALELMETVKALEERVKKLETKKAKKDE